MTLSFKRLRRGDGRLLACAPTFPPSPLRLLLLLLLLLLSSLSLMQKKGDLTTEGKSVRAMDHPELSLAPSLLSTFHESSNSSSSDTEPNTWRKRKCSWDEPRVHTNIDLQLDDPLPLDWEQCLDLQSGRMYYLNRKTLKRTWSMPKERKLDLDLNISAPSIFEGSNTASKLLDDEPKKQTNTAATGSSGGGMFAVPCLKCHLLVMLSRSSPSCPNCKYVHPLPAHQNPSRKMEAVKPLETLSLLN